MLKDNASEIEAIRQELQTADNEEVKWLIQRLGDLGTKAAPVLRDIIENNKYDVEICKAASYYLIEILK